MAGAAETVGDSNRLSLRGEGYSTEGEAASAARVMEDRARQKNEW
jgi:hypothetical protein